MLRKGVVGSTLLTYLALQPGLFLQFDKFYRLVGGSQNVASFHRALKKAIEGCCQQGGVARVACVGKLSFGGGGEFDQMTGDDVFKLRMIKKLFLSLKEERFWI